MAHILGPQEMPLQMGKWAIKMERYGCQTFFVEGNQNDQ